MALFRFALWRITVYTPTGHEKFSRATRNTVDCDQCNYSSRTVFSHIPNEFGQTGISAIQSADLENPTVEPNMKWIAISPRYGHLKFSKCEVVGRSVGPQYILLLTLISYTPLRYVRNVAREE